jgi:hypothetical protein
MNRPARGSDIKLRHNRVMHQVRIIAFSGLDCRDHLSSLVHWTVKPKREARISKGSEEHIPMTTEKTESFMDRRKFLIASGTVATTARVGMGQSFARAPQAAAPAPAAKEEKPTNSLEQRLAQYAANVRFEELPTEVVQACKLFMLDALACSLGAVDSLPAKIAEATIRKAFGSSGHASVIASSQLMGAEGASLVNATLLRYLDLNDVYFGNDPSHPSEIIPPAIACCEEAGRSGRGRQQTRSRELVFSIASHRLFGYAIGNN